MNLDKGDDDDEKMARHNSKTDGQLWPITNQVVNEHVRVSLCE